MIAAIDILILTEAIGFAYLFVYLFIHSLLLAISCAGVQMHRHDPDVVLARKGPTVSWVGTTLWVKESTSPASLTVSAGMGGTQRE